VGFAEFVEEAQSPKAAHQTRLGDAPVVEIADGGHDLGVEQPEAVASAVLDFLSTHEPHEERRRAPMSTVMRDLAPGIVRHRLLIEATYTVATDEVHVDGFLRGLAAHLGLRTYAQPTIVAPGGIGKADNQGYDAFLPLIDSGISLYVWTQRRFLACVLFTCKAFDNELAVSYLKDSWGTKDIAFQAF
jgi:hypothetical protein